MKSGVCRVAVFLLVGFFCKGTFAQGREIPNLSVLLTDSFAVGDSCFVPQEYALDCCFGKNCLCPKMVLACDSIHTFLKQNPSVSIAIICHSDFRPIPMTNDTLTERRANRIKEEILKYGGIDPDRIIAVGMGDNQLRIVTKEIHKQYEFLPVGQVLSAEFCRTIISDRQNYETAVGLNRRTVVKIVSINGEK